MGMKVGDLVELSAYGKKRKRAGWIQHDDVGLVVRVVKYDRGHYPDDYEVRWMKSTFTRDYQWMHEKKNTRKDLKFVKPSGR